MTDDLDWHDDVYDAFIDLSQRTGPDDGYPGGTGGVQSPGMSDTPTTPDPLDPDVPDPDLPADPDDTDADD